MRIGINATCINDRPSGARQRFVGLLTQLARLMPGSEFVVFEPEDCRMAEWFPGAGNVIMRRTPLSSQRRWQRYIRGLSFWPRVFANERFDLFEALHMPATRARTGKTLLTIHDVRGLHPESGWLARQLFRRVLQKSLQRADRVVTVSQAMRAEILAFSDAKPVSVIYNGLDVSHFAALNPLMRDQAAARLRLPQHYLLAVGHFEPRKNYGTLVDALAVLRSNGARLSLVIIGNDSGERARIEAQVAAAGLQASVRLLSGLTDDEVRCAYRGAAMLVFPSRYEGFGIPLLEAMASDIPVVASDIPVFREILGDAGVYFDPDSADSMASTISTIMASPGIQTQLVTRGAMRVKDFDFEVLAGGMAALYRSMVERG
jgi:glycosyltransferase involved in cell wall biosynthesis